jgi:hypothetical protein
MNTENYKYRKALETLNRYKQIYGEKITKIIGLANHYILLNLTDGLVAGLPQPAQINGDKVWSVPILLSAKYLHNEEVGVIFIDETRNEVLGATENSIIMRNIEMLMHDETELA